MKISATYIKGVRIPVAVILILLAFCDLVSAQRYFTKIYTEADGISCSMIYDVNQDASGVMWFATRSGISSYNGLAFRNYSCGDGLPSMCYGFLMRDETGRMWALPKSGRLHVSCFDGKRWLTRDPPPGMQDSLEFTSFDVFHHDEDLVFLVGTQDRGAFVYRNGRWKQYTIANGMPGNGINSIRGAGGFIYVATEKGPAVIREGRVEDFIVPAAMLPAQIVLAIGIDGNNPKQDQQKIWLLGEDWLGYALGDKFTLVTRNFKLPMVGDMRYSFLYSCSPDEVYFGNRYGVYYFSARTNLVERIDRNSGLISDGATSVFIDREKNTWISGLRGVTRIPSKRFATFDSYNGLFENEVASATEYSPGKYVFGYQGALTFYDGSRFKHLVLDGQELTGRPESRVMDICKDKHHNLWFAAAFLGLGRIDGNRHVTWFREKQGIKGYVSSVTVTGSGDVYAVTIDGLFRLSGGCFQKITLKKIPNVGIRKIFPGPGNSLYLATIANGLVWLDGENETVYQAPGPSTANSVFSYLTDSRGKKLVGTNAGLYIVQEEALIKDPDHQIDIRRPVYVILEDSLHHLWFGTDNGIYRWDGTTLEHFTIRDGISGQECNRSAGFVDSNRHIWFGTNNGLTLFRPEFDYDLKTIPPPLVRLNFLVAGKDTLSLKDHLDLSSNQNEIQVNLSVLSMIDEDHLLIRYRLEGLDTAWSPEMPYYSDNLRFDNLPAGKYRLCVKACNALRIWSQPVYSSVIRIANPFWYRWWFILLALLLLAMVTFSAAWFVMLRRSNRRLEAMVSERTRELVLSEQQLRKSNAAKDKFFSIIGHDLRGPFHTILGYSEMLGDGEVLGKPENLAECAKTLNTAANQIYTLVENLLEWAGSKQGKIIFTPLKFDLSILSREVMEVISTIAASKNITFRSNIAKNFTVTADINMIRSVLRNLAMNAIKFTPSGGYVEMSAVRADSRVEVSVKDTGVGMTRDVMAGLFDENSNYTTPGTENEKGSGLGLILCREFIELHGGKISVESEPGKGSTFIFTIPLIHDSEN